MQIWETRYDVIRGERLVNRSRRSEYRLFELAQHVHRRMKNGRSRQVTVFSSHYEFGDCDENMTHATNLTTTRSFRSLDASPIRREKHIKLLQGYSLMPGEGLLPEFVPSLRQYGVDPFLDADTQSNTAYLALAERYLDNMPTEHRQAVRAACIVLVEQHFNGYRNPFEAERAMPMCLVMLAELALDRQHYVDELVAELASGAFRLQKAFSLATPPWQALMNGSGQRADFLLALQRARRMYLALAA